MSPTAKAHWQIHLCVLLWGFTAIFGKLITLPALPLVVAHAAGGVVLLLLPRVWRGLRALPPETALAMPVSALVALHWLTFVARSSWPTSVAATAWLVQCSPR